MVEVEDQRTDGSGVLEEVISVFSSTGEVVTVSDACGIRG
jgi:hypothetical protein